MIYAIRLEPYSSVLGVEVATSAARAREDTVQLLLQPDLGDDGDEHPEEESGEGVTLEHQ